MEETPFSLFQDEEIEKELTALRYRCMMDGHPEINMPRFLSGEFGRRYAEYKLMEDRFATDPMNEKLLQYYASLHLKKEMFETEDYYTRWTLITPEPMEEGKKYPLIIFAHGAFGPLEGAEFGGYQLFQAQEGFMALYPQNTNPDWIEHILEQIKARYPLDAERVYMGGYSAGGAKSAEAALKIRDTLAAVAPCACGITHWSEDILSEPDPEDYDRVPPMIRVDSEFDPSRFIPFNKWVPRVTMLDYFGVPRPPMPPRPQGADFDRDPTFDMVPDGKGGMVSSKVKPGPKIPPPDGITYDEWKAAQLRYRLKTMGCAELDLPRCMAFANSPDERIHSLFGVYGDREYEETYWGVRHLFLDYYNQSHRLTARLVAIENAPHNPTPMLPQLTWDFFKRFRRDSATGKIVEIQ